ncbi:sugar transferase [Nostocoides australiense]
MNTNYESQGKRIVDVVCSGTALIVLSPLLLAASVAVRLSSRGPIIFKQARVGAGGGKFTLLKFRTMPVNTAVVSSADAGGLAITPVGRVLRRTNVDELPQLLNILRGEMSVVGPRPALPSQADLLLYRTLEGSGRLRPGLTGLAQINSFDGMQPKEKATWDETYARRVTFRGDLAIVLATLRYLTKPPPRY